MRLSVILLGLVAFAASVHGDSLAGNLNDFRNQQLPVRPELYDQYDEYSKDRPALNALKFLC